MTPFTLRATNLEASKSQIIIDCGFRNPITNNNASRLEAAIKKAGLVPESDYAVVQFYSWCMATTRTMEFINFDEDTSEPLIMLQRFWLWFWEHVVITGESPYHPDGRLINIAFVQDDGLLAESWTRFNMLVSADLQQTWGNFFYAAQVMFPASPLLKPDAMLTSEEKADPGFLAPGKQRERRLGNGRKQKQQPTRPST